MLLPPSEPTTRKPRLGETAESDPAAEREPSVFQRMADWVRTGMGVLQDVYDTTEQADWGQQAELTREGLTLSADAHAGENGQSPPGGVRGLGQRIRSWVGRVRSWVRDNLPPRRQDHFLQALDALRTEMQAEMGALRSEFSELKSGQTRLEMGQAEMRSDIAELKAGQAEMRTDIAELKSGQAELGNTVGSHGQKLDVLLQFTQGEAALRLEAGCRRWGRLVLPRLFKQLRPLRGAPSEQWQIPVQVIAGPWHDHLDPAEHLQVWTDLDLDETLDPETVTCDLLMRIRYGMPDGRTQDCLVVGESTRTVDPGGDVGRLRDWRSTLEDLHPDLPVVPCLFASERSTARSIAELPILHMVSAHGRDWEKDPDFRAKMARILDLQLDPPA